MNPTHTPHVVHDENIDLVAAALAQAPLIALDTEFHSEGRYTPDLYLVQLHVPDVGTWIVDPLAGDHLARLGPALRGGATWLVHAGNQDLNLMQRAIGGVATTVLDTQVAAGLVSSVYPDALDRLVARWLQQDLPKAAQLSDWSHRPLTEAQRVYAARDVLCLPALWDAIMEEAERLGRTQMVFAACTTVAHDALDTSTSKSWRQILRNTATQGRAAAILRELVGWRDAEARRANRPAPFILGDAMLRQIAKAKPTTLGELATNRRMKPKAVDRHGKHLIAAVRRGLDVPESELPWTAPRGSAQADRVTWLTLAVSALGRERAFAPRLALPEHHIEPLARRPMNAREDVSAILEDWRDDLIGEALFDALQGRLSLRANQEAVFAERR